MEKKANTLKALRIQLWSLWKGWGMPILVAVVLATSFKSAIADWNDIPSGSMLPTILIGDRVWVNKLAYDLKVPYTTVHLAKWGDPQRGDIVVFFSPRDGQRLIKRVIGLPGDIIHLEQNKLSLNGIPVHYKTFEKGVRVALPDSHLVMQEDLVGHQHTVMFTTRYPSMHSFGPQTVPQDHFFVMGDNRNNSADSRVFGFVARDLIVGRASTVVLSREGSMLHPRWYRFFHELR